MPNERMKIFNNEPNKNNIEKENINKRKERKRRLRVAFTKMSFMAMLLIFSTYAWFTSQRNVTFSNLRGKIEVVENMEISLDAKTWTQKIDLSDAKTVFEEAQESKDRVTLGTAKAILPNQLLPVSTCGIDISFENGGIENNHLKLPMYGGKAKRNITF